MTTSAAQWGSDVIAGCLADAGVGLVTCMPGSTVRGLLETYSSGVAGACPPLLPAVHENSAVAIAHGYTKTAGQPAAVLLHSSVGLLNAAMAIYNAALDHAPLLLLVGTAPLREDLRRPWIDRIHAGEEFADLAADLVKRVAVAATLEHAVDALRAGMQHAVTPPRGPVAVFVDRLALEQRIPPELSARPPLRLASQPPMPADAGIVSVVATALTVATHPVLLAGRLGTAGWDERVQLAESTGMSVLTDLRLPGAFPTNHPCHVGGLDMQGRPFGSAAQTLHDADVVLALEWADPVGVSNVGEWGTRSPRILVDVGTGELMPAPQAAHPEDFPFPHHHAPGQGQSLIDALLALPSGVAPRHLETSRAKQPERPLPGPLTLESAAGLLRHVLKDRSTCLVKVPVEWHGEWWDVTDCLDYLGGDGGGGLGSGPGLAVGAALGLPAERLAVAVLGDGDLLVGIHSLWSATVTDTALLLVIIDNRGFANEARHLEQVSVVRERASRWQDQAFLFRRHPVDIAGLARDMGLHAFGPAADTKAAEECIKLALTAVDNRQAALVHLRVSDGGEDQ